MKRRWTWYLVALLVLVAAGMDALLAPSSDPARDVDGGQAQ